MQFTRMMIAAVLLGSCMMGTALDRHALAADDAAAEVASEGELHGDGAHAADEHAADGHGAGEHGGDTNPVTLDPDLAIVTAVIFLLLLGVLWKFAWGPIVASLDKREHTVAEQLADAKRSQEEAKRLLVEHQQQLSGTAAEVKQMLEQARKDAEAQKQDIIESAQAAATAEKDRALREISAAKNSALEDLARTSVDTAVDLAGRIVRRQLNPNEHSELIGDALQKFSRNN
jgi:F-type H+-transporting ATPase subunit b